MGLCRDYEDTTLKRRSFMSLAPLRIGLVGAGRVAQQVHLKVLTRLPEVKVAALAEPNEDHRRTAQHLVPKAKSYTDVHPLLEDDEIEAVLICLPNALHAEAALAALERGKHVYLEKPLATNLTDAEAVVTTWRQTGVTGMMGFNYRYNPLYQSLKQHLRSVTIGKVIYVRSVFSTTGGGHAVWKRTRQEGGGVLLDLAAHHIDLIRYFFEEEIEEVRANLQSRESEDDTAAVEMQLRSGILVQSFFSLSGIEEDRFEIVGEAGKLTVERNRSLCIKRTEPEANRARRGQFLHGLRTLAHASYGLKKLRSAWNEPSYRAALSCFVEAVRGQPVSYPDFEDGYRNLAVIEAAEASAQTGHFVSLTCSP